MKGLCKLKNIIDICWPMHSHAGAWERGYNLPCGNLSFQLCLRVGSTRVLLDEPHNSSMNYDPTKVES